MASENTNTTPPAPQDIQAELAAIGSALAEIGIAGGLAELGLEPKHFYKARHAAVFQALVEIHTRGLLYADGPADPGAVRAMLRELGHADIADDTALFVELPEGIPNLSNAEYYARRIIDTATRRELISAKTHEIARLYDPTQALPEGQSAGALTRCLGDVEPEGVRWLWPGRIPSGKLTILSGDPGLGKSFLTIDLAARVSRGMPWPDSDCAADTREEG
jgi:hypothetical protein